MFRGQLISQQKPIVEFTEMSSSDPSVTMLVVGMVTLFLVCQLPDFCLRLTETMIQLLGVKPNWRPFTAPYINTATNALLAVNASANCFVYCFSGRRFVISPLTADGMNVKAASREVKVKVKVNVYLYSASS